MRQPSAVSAQQPGLDLVAGASFESADVGINDDTGIGLRVDLRWLVPDSRLELSPGLRYVDLYDDGDAALKEMMGAEFSSAFVKMKTQEWNSYMGHFSDWEKANALDI